MLALVAGGVALIAALGSLVLAWINVGKAKAAAAEAKAQAETAKAVGEVNSQRLTNTNARIDLTNATLTNVALRTPTATPDAPKGPLQ